MSTRVAINDLGRIGRAILKLVFDESTRALPQYARLFDGVAVRAPIPVGSIADIAFVVARPTSVGEGSGDHALRRSAWRVA